ncbi:MAG TPA: hypothetical protein EYP64_01515, partial [Desulfarculaceae bacterium]|nr:hypothetical protein [Desulfarculaceae bacterium]
MNSSSSDNEPLNDANSLIAMECGPYGIVACNSQGEVIFANKSAARMLNEAFLEKGNILKIMATEVGFEKGWKELISGAENQFSIFFQNRNTKPDSTPALNNNNNN